MYIFELFIKIIKDFKKRKPKETHEEIEKCEHVFIPIDSTGKIFACSRCGEIYKKED